MVVESAKIVRIERAVVSADSPYLLPGFVDAHVHIESSMLVPSEFARLAVRHGTVATVSDPHEIANVLGVSGVDYMIANAQTVPFHFFFGAPSCVPATSFETSGAVIDAAETEILLANPHIWYLSEMMNYPGVLYHDEQVMAKISAARKHNKPIDGHAPGLRGEEARQYFAAGIGTDHECFTLEEAREKAVLGVKILIREGSAAKNFEALHPLFQEFPDLLMFCSDDKHPDDLVLGHINQLVRRALQLGYDRYDVLRAACIHPVEHYGLPVGTLKEGDPADFIVVDHPETLQVLSCWIKGECVARQGETLFNTRKATEPNNFYARQLTAEDIYVEAAGPLIRVIEALDGQLITRETEAEARIVSGNVVSDCTRDVLKMVVVNRYQKASPATAFIRGFGLKTGAIASTVAHDSHNIVAVGTTDKDILDAIHQLMAAKGGICFSSDTESGLLPLPVGGLMSTSAGEIVGADYQRIDAMVKRQGCSLHAPFMTLSFMALLVIPQLKLSDLGLFDGNSFMFTKLFK